MNKTTVLVGIVAVVALVVGLVALTRPAPEVIVGAAAGPDHTETQFFLGGSVDGLHLATTTGSTTPFSSNNTGAHLAGVSRIDITPTIYQPTFSFPAEVDLGSLVPTKGMTQRTLVCNATTTAVKDGRITIAVGAGVTLNNASTTAHLFTKDCAEVIFSRDAGGGLDVFFSPGAN